MTRDKLTQCLPTTTSAEADASEVAILPIGAFEQHGPHLPLSTDTLLASTIARRVAEEYGLVLLPPITLSCSHEHEGVLAGAVSLSASTLDQVIKDIANSLERSRITRLVVISGHGGNHVLANTVQESSVHPTRRMMLFPERGSWIAAIRKAGCQARGRSDVHAGEIETSILLHAFPELVSSERGCADRDVPERPDLLTLGVAACTNNGVLGFPSLATAAKGSTILEVLVEQFNPRLALLRNKAAPDQLGDGDE